jgi:hypothetical protein
MWEGRWDAVVVVARALWTNVLDYWWSGPVLVVILLAVSRRAWFRLVRFIGVSFVRGGTGD